MGSGKEEWQRWPYSVRKEGGGAREETVVGRTRDVQRTALVDWTLRKLGIKPVDLDAGHTSYNPSLTQLSFLACLSFPGFGFFGFRGKSYESQSRYVSRRSPPTGSRSTTQSPHPCGARFPQAVGEAAGSSGLHFLGNSIQLAMCVWGNPAGTMSEGED